MRALAEATELLKQLLCSLNSPQQLFHTMLACGSKPLFPAHPLPSIPILPSSCSEWVPRARFLEEMNG